MTLWGAAAHLRMEQSRTLNETSFRSLPLGFPRGEAVTVKYRHFGTDILS